MRPQDCEGIMFVARIVKWDQVNAALGTLEGSLGKNSDIKVRTEGLLIENNIDYSEFESDVLKDLPSNHESWTIPPAELKRRRDFRKECVFTIDPLTARDLDDALSVTKEDNGLYRVGVHIADVSYFVREETALDRVAGERTTSTYLVDQVSNLFNSNNILLLTFLRSFPCCQGHCVRTSALLILLKTDFASLLSGK